MKIYVFTADQAFDGECFDLIVKAFAKKEDAAKELNSFKEDVRKDIKESWEIERDDEDVYRASQSMDYANQHVELMISEVEVVDSEEDKKIRELFEHEFLTDLLTTASYQSFWFEGRCLVYTDLANVGHPSQKALKQKELYDSAKKKYDCREDIWADILLNGGELYIIDVEEDERYTITLDDLIKGFKIVRDDYPHIYNNIMDENYDLLDADAVIQCAVFGEMVLRLKRL